MDELVKKTKEALDKYDKVIYLGVPMWKAQTDSHPDINNAQLLFFHEHGTLDGKLPPRPVLRPTIQLNEKIITKVLGEVAVEVLKGNHAKADLMMEQLSLLLQNEAQEFIQKRKGKDFWAIYDISKKTANKKKKGSDPEDHTTLIDTGAMVASIKGFVGKNK